MKKGKASSVKVKCSDCVKWDLEQLDFFDAPVIEVVFKNTEARDENKD